jgi:hypothetical protein
MDVALIVIVAVLVLLVAAVSLKGRRARRTARGHEQDEARVIAERGEAQHDESLRRRADVRAARAERDPRVGSDTDE